MTLQLIYRLSSGTAVVKREKILPFSMFTFLKVTQRRHRSSSGASIFRKIVAEFAFYTDEQDFSGNTESILCKVAANELNC